MKDMPILAETMASLVTSCNQAFRSSIRSREMDDEAPRSKRVRASGERAFEKPVNDKTGGTSSTAGECSELDSFEPGTPKKSDTLVEPARKMSGGWDTLELCLLERITRSLSASDLCRLAQVNKHYQELCSRDTLWAWRAAENGFAKAVEVENWRLNVTDSLKAAPLDSLTSLHFSGDVTIVDPFHLFFQGKSNASKLSELRKIVKGFGHKDLVLTYRGVQSAILRTSCIIHDDDTAFEVFRNGQEIGANVTTSGVIAVVPKRLVLKLIQENGGMPEEVRGVTVTGVDGILRCSLDGDFIIRHSVPSRGTPVHFPYTGEIVSADIVCSTGGSWTEDSDSDDEEEELTDEEMAEAVAEVAKITNSKTSLQRFHCNGEGLIHKFTNFEVSMLS
ncbi:uncharacterized protein [Physcomitrium patens]|uniref:F-box domain-containing protein n=1 Tax=Physcomitrium patens TaxID=3218 RepID=A9TLC0_PHYPA|nr:uncharacterized protein LOC112288877 [Physcomitrium patens]PNR62519.1 hypothetical protein PHYPA_000943 [Physcomitrium patens]|eukprot:XP_024389340.1 uncharacterized protein LOC112288877 [Physcomitrella patens]